MTALLTETTRDLTIRLVEELRRRKGETLKAAQVLRDLASCADVLVGILLSSWSWILETLEGEGFEGKELAQHCRVLLDGIDGSLASHEGLLALAEAAGLTGEEAGLTHLASRLPTLREVRPRVAETLTLTTRPGATHR